MKLYSLFILVFSISAFAQKGIKTYELQLAKQYLNECKQVAQFTKSPLYNVQCYLNYNHYHPNKGTKYSSTSAKTAGKVKIAGFNVLHPGMGKTRFKDNNLIARIMNEWDVIGAVELIPLVADDLKHNTSLVEFLKEAPAEVKQLNADIKALKAKLRTTTAQRSIDSLNKKIAIAGAEVKSLLADIKKAPSLYRAPGYLEILTELKKMDPSWGLILAPRGEAAKVGDVEELVGFYYRGSRVKPKSNEYCKTLKTIGHGTPYACLAEMGADMLGTSKKDIFSRRPFMAEFSSGKFSFTLLSSHVIFTSPSDSQLRSKILRKAFGVRSYKDLPMGVNASNYARFAEVKVTLDFMQALRTKFRQKDVILVGDFNLEKYNTANGQDIPFWNDVLASMPGSELYVEDKTSVTIGYYDKNGNKTEGLASNYDHFIFDPSYTDECDGNRAKAYSLYSGKVARTTHSRYRVRASQTPVNGKLRLDSKKIC
jgi:hypothetical protein